eukprot:5668264-Pyramimonas_sp.AAC.1
MPRYKCNLGAARASAHHITQQPKPSLPNPRHLPNRSPRPRSHATKPQRLKEKGRGEVEPGLRPRVLRSPKRAYTHHL